MNQLTIRGIDDALESRIQQLAHQEGISLNRAVMKLLRRGAGLAERGGSANTIGTALDHLIGTWTAEEASETEQALEDLSQVDEAMWT